MTNTLIEPGSCHCLSDLRPPTQPSSRTYRSPHPSRLPHRNVSPHSNPRSPLLQRLPRSNPSQRTKRPLQRSLCRNVPNHRHRQQPNNIQPLQGPRKGPPNQQTGNRPLVEIALVESRHHAQTPRKNTHPPSHLHLRQRRRLHPSTSPHRPLQPENLHRRPLHIRLYKLPRRRRRRSNQHARLS